MKQFYFTRTPRRTVIYVPQETDLGEARAILDDAKRLFGPEIHISREMPDPDIFEPLEDEVEPPRPRYYAPGHPNSNFNSNPDAEEAE